MPGVPDPGRGYKWEVVGWGANWMRGFMGASWDSVSQKWEVGIYQHIRKDFFYLEKVNILETIDLPERPGFTLKKCDWGHRLGSGWVEADYGYVEVIGDKAYNYAESKFKRFLPVGDSFYYLWEPDTSVSSQPSEWNVDLLDDIVQDFFTKMNKFIENNGK